MRQTMIVAVFDADPRPADVVVAAADADWLEIRAGAHEDVDLAGIRAAFRGPLLYSLNDRANRVEALLRAAERFDYIDLQPGDLVPDVLRAIPRERRVVSVHVDDGAKLATAFAVVARVPARLYRLTASAPQSGDELAAPRLLHDLGRDDVTAYAVGPTGLWTRILAPWLGAPVVFGAGAGDDAAAGMPSVARLVESFGFPALPAVDELFGMVGNPVLHSLSPRIHNTAYRELGRRALYLPFHVASFEKFWTRVVCSGALDALGFPLRGLSVVSPHKTTALDAVEQRSDIVQRALSTNVFRRNGGAAWRAETTDADGVLITLRERGVQPRNQKAAVIGCGGSGRAMAAALHAAGADVTLVNRGIERGSLAVGLLHLPYVPLSEFSCDGYGIVVNATPVGRDTEALPFPVQRLRRDAVVVDLVYRDAPTELIRSTRGPGRITIDGWDMLTAQARHQFELMTGMEMPEELIRQTLGLEPPAAVSE